MKYAEFNENGLPTGFYDSKLNEGKIPKNAIEITDSQWREFVNNSGKRKFVNGEVVNHTPSINYKVELKAIRDTQIYGGIDFNGFSIDTDLSSVTAISEAAKRAKLDTDFVLFWYIEGNEIPLDAQTIIAIDDAIFDNGQNAFKAAHLVDVSSVESIENLKLKFKTEFDKL